MTAPKKAELLETGMQLPRPGARPLCMTLTFCSANGEGPKQLLEVVIDDPEEARRIGDAVVLYLSRSEA